MTETDPESDELPTGWVPIGEYGWFTAMVALSPVAGGLVVVWVTGLVLDASLVFGEGMSIANRILLFAGALALAVAIIAYVQSVRAPRPFANFETSEFRFGRRTIPMSDIVWARLVVAQTTRKGRSVSLLFGAGRRQAAFRLRDSADNPIEDVTGRLLAEVLRRTSVVMPTAKEDPKNKFQRFNFPFHVTKDEAIALVLSPPAHGEELPIPPLI